MDILTFHNTPSQLEYKVWRAEDFIPTLLVEGKITGIAQERGEHSYSYGFGSGKGKSRTLNYMDALLKINEIIKLVSRGLGRLKGYEIKIDAVGYLLWKRPREISASGIITDGLVGSFESNSSHIPGGSEYLPDLHLMQTGRKHYPSAGHVAVFDDLMFQTSPQDQKMYPLPRELVHRAAVTRFTNGAIRIQSILENARRLLKTLPRRIIVCDIDEVPQVTGLKGETVIVSTHEFGGQSRLFSRTNCGAINPSVIKAISEKTGLLTGEIVEQMMAHSGVHSFPDNFDSIRDLCENIKLGNLQAPENLFVGGLLSAIAGSVALMGGLGLLVISGAFGVLYPSLRSLLLKRLSILRLSIDETKNELQTREAMEITGRDCKVQIVVAHAETDKQVAQETYSILRRQKGGR